MAIPQSVTFERSVKAVDQEISRLIEQRVEPEGVESAIKKPANSDNSELVWCAHW